MAEAVGSQRQDVIFTSGATEAITIGIVGAVLGRSPSRPNVVVSATEHKAVLSSAALAARLSGGELRTVGVGRDGRVDLNALDEAADDTVAVIAVMAANNETGLMSDTAAVAALAVAAGAWFFCDATQAFGKTAFTVPDSGADLVCLSGHKAYGRPLRR